MPEWTDVIEMNQRAAIIKGIQQGNKGNQNTYKPKPCGGRILELPVSESYYRRFGLKGKRAVILQCKFCDKDSVVADRKCLWCGENDSWILNDYKELACHTCRKHFTSATCKHCKKESPAMRLFLLYSPESIKDLNNQCEEDAKASDKKWAVVRIFFWGSLIFGAIYLYQEFFGNK